MFWINYCRHANNVNVHRPISSDDVLCIYINLNWLNTFIKLLIHSSDTASPNSWRALRSVTAAMLSALSYAIMWPMTVIRTALAIGLMWIASSLPILQDKIKKYNEKYFLVPYEDFWQSWCSWNMLSTVVKLELAELKKTARLGLPAPNCHLISTDGKEGRILEFVKGNRPLVLNFGSCS